MINIRVRVFLTDLMLLGIHGYDMILGMDWLTKYQAIIDYKRKILAVVTPEGERFTYRENDPALTIPLISATKAYKLVRNGCTTYLCSVEVSQTPDLDLRDIPVARELPEVFQEVPGLPPD